MMQENRDRSTVCFVSKPREASPERPTRRKDRGDAASTPHLLDPTEAHWDGCTSLSEEVWIIPSWRFYDPLGPRGVRALSGFFISATVHLAHPDADLSEDGYGGQHPLVERGEVVRAQRLEE